MRPQRTPSVCNEPGPASRSKAGPQDAIKTLYPKCSCVAMQISKLGNC
jgi:hypothetical protein